MKKNHIIKFVAVILIGFLLFSCKKDSSNEDSSNEEILDPMYLDCCSGDQPLPTYGHRDNWMKDVDDELYLSEIAIPGSHDSGADKHSTKNISDIEKPFAIAQDFGFINQAYLGVRWFDIRLEYDGGNLNLHHAWYDLSKQFHDILDWSVGYVNTYPTEVIILMVKQEYSSASDADFGNAVYEKIEQHGLQYFYLQNNVPTLGDVRGKVFIVRRFHNVINKDFGIEFSWEDNTTGLTSDSYRETDGIGLWAQDHYSISTVSTSTKYDQYVNMVEKAHNEHNPNTFFLNFVSGERVYIGETLWETANQINHLAKNFLDSRGMYYHNCGIIMINFAGGGDVNSGERNCAPYLVNTILSRNEGVPYE
ncbi:MAG: hypothetical protein K8R41_00080 [Bacteroidales bacterium]|nr:hypothetical protein [Bacteroidales bacterium]